MPVTQADKVQKNKSNAVANNLAARHGHSKSMTQFVDNRREAVQIQKLQKLVSKSPGVNQMKTYREVVAQQHSSLAQAKVIADPLTVQRKFFYENFETNEKEDALGEAVGALVNGAREWKELDDEKNISIYIHVDESSSPNPAEITNPVKDDRKPGHWVFVLNIRRWFIRSSPIGHVIGTLNHEIGVHALPYIRKIKENSEAELNGSPLPHKEEDLSARKKGGIDDHQRAMTKGTSEFKIYFDIAVNAANALKNAGKQQEAVDTLFAYLMDLAAMAPNGDKGIIVLKGMIPSPLQQETFAYVLKRYNEFLALLPEDWKPLIPKMSVKDVENAFMHFRSQIPKKKAVISGIGVLILIILIIMILRSF